MLLYEGLANLRVHISLINSGHKEVLAECVYMHIYAPIQGTRVLVECARVCMYIYLYIYIYVYIHVYIYIYTCIRKGRGASMQSWYPKRKVLGPKIPWLQRLQVP